jgi:biopolymer transport protein ExbB/TolQ
MSAHGIEQAIFNVADALLVPVLLAALASLALAIFELGRLSIEMWNRRGRSSRALEDAVTAAQKQLADGNAEGAQHALTTVGRSAAMRTTIAELFEHRTRDDYEDWSAKQLADFDYASLKRLERTRILVRLGPALGLMGTLIPLSPGLSALSRGDTAKLSEDLRIAFSITVLGLLVGAVAYAISLVRDRLYSHDLSDLEYLATAIGSFSTSEVSP